LLQENDLDQAPISNKHYDNRAVIPPAEVKSSPSARHVRAF